MSAATLPLPEGYDYAPFYCEENVYRLCMRPGFAFEGRFATLIRARGPAFPIRGQRAAAPGKTLWWDYHAIYLDLAAPEGPQVYDLDTLFGFPCGIDDYIHGSFLPSASLDRSEAPLFKLIPAGEYLKVFSSDRSHMHRPDGSWIKPPPPWPPIGKGNELMRLLSLEDGEWQLSLGGHSLP